MRPSGSILRFSDTMSDDITLPLDDAELDELNELLASRSDGDALLLDGAQGLVTAVAISPGAIGPEEWMPYLIDHERAFDSVEQAEHVVRLLLRLRRSGAEQSCHDKYKRRKRIDDGHWVRADTQGTASK